MRVKLGTASPARTGGPQIHNLGKALKNQRLAAMSIASALLLSACAAPDWCYDNRAEVETCLELKRQGQDVECACQTAASGKVTASTPDKPDRPKPGPVDPGDDDDDDDGEDPDDDDHHDDDDDDRGHGNDEDGHDEDNPGKSDGIRVVVYDKWPSRGRW